MEVVFAALLSAAIGGGVAFALAGRMDSPPEALQRTNYRGRTIPAILGEAVVLGGLVAVAALALLNVIGWDEAPNPRMSGALALLIAAMGAAGSWDDHRGDERPRGFKGHLGAIKSLRLTGGLVKLIAGGVVGLVAGAILGSGDVATTIEVGLLVALTANLINLFDRAPGRAAKVTLLLVAGLAFFAAEGWIVGSAGLFGALGVLLRYDLAEEAMLGDAGANPLGAALGLGMATALSQPGRWVAIVVLLALNAASEKWSFSELIERTPWLRRADLWGRPRSDV